jgi:hypothetical protein
VNPPAAEVDDGISSAGLPLQGVASNGLAFVRHDAIRLAIATATAERNSRTSNVDFRAFAQQVVVFEQAKLLARNMEKDATDFYKACVDPNTACHRWHYIGEDGVLHVRSGTIIQKAIWTKPRFYSTSPDFLWVYNHCLLKTGNEAVVEGMCKVIGRHADSTRGLSIGRYAMEARLVWNAPLQHEADAFLTESLDHFFGLGEKWHFHSVDTKNRPLVSVISKVIDKLRKRVSKFSFMKEKKC